MKGLKRLCFVDCGKPTDQCECKKDLFEQVMDADLLRSEGVFEQVSGEYLPEDTIEYLKERERKNFEDDKIAFIENMEKLEKVSEEQNKDDQ